MMPMDEMAVKATVLPSMVSPMAQAARHMAMMAFTWREQQTEGGDSIQ
jgi:hypothetical protein